MLRSGRISSLTIATPSEGIEHSQSATAPSGYNALAEASLAPAILDSDDIASRHRIDLITPEHESDDAGLVSAASCRDTPSPLPTRYQTGRVSPEDENLKVRHRPVFTQAADLRLPPLPLAVILLRVIQYLLLQFAQSSHVNRCELVGSHIKVEEEGALKVKPPYGVN